MAWTRPLLKTKSKALALHLGVSAVIFVPLLAMIWHVWFPPPFFFTDGGWQGVRIMLVVDMVIGPALTFLVYDPAKTRRALAVDYTFICLVQAAALVYGYVSVESKRIWAIAYHEGAFAAVTRDRFKLQNQADDWSAFGDGPPYWVWVREPRDSDESAGVLAFALTDGVAQRELYFLYEPLAAHAAQLKAAGEARDGLRFYPLNGYYRLAKLGLDDDRRLRATEYGEDAPD